MRLVVVVLALLVALSSAAEGASCVSKLPFGAPVSGTVGDSCVWRLEFLVGSQERMFEVHLEGGTGGAGHSAGLQAVVMNEHFTAINTVAVDHNPQQSVTLCRVMGQHEGKVALDTVYYIQVVGAPDERYTLSAQILTARVNLGQSVQGKVSELPRYFWGIFPPPAEEGQPLSVRVRSPQGSMPYKLTVTWDVCPDTNVDPTKRNFLTFTKKATMHVLPQQSRNPSIWYITVEPLMEQNDQPVQPKTFELVVTYADTLNSSQSVVAWSIAIVVGGMALLVGLVASTCVCADGVKRVRGIGLLKDPSRMWDAKHSKRRTKVFLWSACLAGVFFAVPAIQTVTAEVQESVVSGNRDNCYYNEECMVSYSVTGVYAFTWWAVNNMISNAGYLVVGVLGFSYVTFLQKKQRGKERFLKYLELPHDYSLHYAYSMAVFFEGVLSATYHVCPNRSIFQIDTAFMFVIAVFIALEVYRKWFGTLPHPFFAILLLASFLLFNFFGVQLDVVAAQYELGFALSWSLAFGCLWMLVVILVVLRHRYGMPIVPLIILSAVLIIVGWLPLFSLAEGTWSFVPPRATVLLGVALAASLVLLFSYLFGTIHKVEPAVRVIRVVAVLMTIGLAVPSVIYFERSPTNKSLEPWESRNLNAPCVLGGFYDAHDLWHILSAAALGLILLVLIHSGEGSKQDIKSGNIYPAPPVANQALLARERMVNVSAGEHDDLGIAGPGAVNNDVDDWWA